MEKLVYGGDGLARLDGRVVFAPFVLPGERILARAEQEKPGLVRARTVEVLEAAPHRVAAPCPVYGRCGGCHYQHAPYEYQLLAKRAILVEALNLRYQAVQARRRHVPEAEPVHLRPAYLKEEERPQTSESGTTPAVESGSAAARPQTEPAAHMQESGDEPAR